MEFSTLLLQASGGGMVQLVFFGAMLLVFWFFLIRPQAKRQREQGEFMKNLAKGDQIVTASGIIGRINKIEDNMIIIETGKVFLPITRGAVSKEMTDAFLNAETKD